MNDVIGEMPNRRPLLQSRRSDFLWVLEFVDVADDKTETPTDLTDCEFTLTILGLDGTTVKKVLQNGDGVTITDNVVRFEMDMTDFADWTRGCAYPYFLDYTNADGFTKCLYEDKFILS